MTPLVRRILVAAGILAAAYLAYAAFVRVDNGTDVQIAILAGENPDHTMYYRCDIRNSTAGACTAGDQTTVTVHKRDRVTFHVTSQQGPGRTHDFRLMGGAHFLWPSGVEMEIEDGAQAGSFTAWKAGTFPFICELAGHEQAGMRGTLVVQ